MLALVLSAPILVNAVRALTLGWFPTFDLGFLQIRALDVGTHATPLVGMPSTLSAATGITTFHPGPLQSWLQAIPVRVFSFTPSALLIAQVLINIAWIALAVWMLSNSPWSRYRTITVVVGLAFLASISPEIAHDPWNPHAAVIPLAVALLAATLTVVGHARAAWVAVFAGSFAAQCHLSFAAAGAVTVLASLGVLVARSRRGDGETLDGKTFDSETFDSETFDGESRRQLRISAAVFVVCWLGPILDQLFRHGNLEHLVNGGGTGVTLGWTEAWSRFVKVLLPWRLLFDQNISTVELVASVSWWESVIALAIVAGTIVSMARRGGTVRRVAMFLSAVVVGQIALTAVMPMTMGTLFGLHLVRVWWPVVWMMWCCAVCAVSVVLPMGFVRRREFLVGVAMVAAVAAMGTAVVYDSNDVRDGTWYRPSLEVADAIAEFTPTGRYEFAVPGWGFEAPLPVGVAADLVRRGYDLRVDALVTPGLLDDSRRASADVSDRRLTLVVQKVGIDTEVPEGELIYSNTFTVREWSDTEYEVYVYIS